MAVAFTSSGQHYERNLGGITLSQFTITCWVQLTQDRNDYSTFWSVDDDFSLEYLVCQTSDDGTTLSVFPASESVTSLTVGAWYFVGVSFDSGDVTVRVRRDGTTQWISGSYSMSGSSIDARYLRIGESVFGDEWLRGCVAAFKMWDAALSASEMQAEYQHQSPQRTADLFAYYPFETNSGQDASGNGRNLSGGSGATTAAGPGDLTTGPGTPTYRINGWGPVPIF